MNLSIALLGVLLAAIPFTGCGEKESPPSARSAPASTPGSSPASPDTAVGRSSARNGEDTSEVSDDRLRFDDPIFPEGSGVMLLPVRLDEGADDDGSVFDNGTFSKRGEESTREMSRAMANIIVVDKLTNASRALLDRPALVARFELVPASATPKGGIIYAIVDRDSDGDSSLTDEDEMGCYVSDAAANGLRRITPEGLSVRNWYRDGGTFYLRVVADVDHDGSFDKDDRSEQILRYDMGGEGMASRVVGDSLVAATMAIAKKPLH